MGPAGFVERCMLTVLAVDTVDSTSHVADVDPDQARELLDRIFDHVNHAVDEAGGLLVSYSGDGGIAVFGWPSSLENHADRACEAAWRIQELASLSKPLRSADGQPVQFRVGLHSGLVSLRSMKRDVRAGISAVGGTVHLAAALQKCARPDRILLSSKTASLCRSGPQLAPYDGVHDVQKVRLKAYELTTLSAPISSGSALRNDHVPFVGREIERRILRETLTEGRCGAIALLGEPGIGKTRLASTAIEDASLKGMRVLTVSGDNQKCATPYSAIRTLILQSLSLKFDSSDDEILRALLEAGVGKMKPAAAAAVLPRRRSERPKARSFTRTQVARELLKTFQALQSDTPTLVVIDDLQLLDPESVLCLRFIGKAKAGLRWSLLVTSRPEAVVLARSLTDTLLNVVPMQRADMIELARKLWGGAMPRPNVVEKVLDRADGVPFVLEQIALSDEMKDTDWESAIPDSVRSIIHARLNHLSPQTKAFAQALSILGEEVDVDLASRTFGMESQTLLRRRSELERLSIVHPPIANSIRFRHAIVAEACAETVPIARRQQIHRAAMEAILATPGTEGDYERLAFHAEGAGNDQRAVEYLWLAALNARRSSASGSLNLILRRAIACIERIGEPAETKFVDFVLMAFGSLVQLGEFRSLGGHLPRALELARRQNRKGKVGAALCHMSLASWFDARYAEGREQSERALEIAVELKSLPLIFAAKFSLASALYGLGAVERAIAVQRDLCDMLTGELETARLGAAGIPGSIVRTYLCYFLADIGEYSEGLTLVERAIDIARAQGDLYSELLALLARGRSLVRLKRHSEAVACFEHSVELIDQNGYDAILPHILGLQASALARSGEAARAVRDVEAWLNSERDDRAGRLELYYLNAGYAEALAAAGDNGRGLMIADRAVEISRSVSNPCLMANGLGLRARLRVLAGDASGSESDRTEQRFLCERYGIVAET